MTAQCQGWTLGHYHFTDFAYTDILFLISSSPSRQCPPNCWLTCLKNCKDVQEPLLLHWA